MRKFFRSMKKDLKLKSLLKDQAGNAPLVLKDSNGVNFVLYPDERKYIVERLYWDDDGVQANGMKRLIRSGDIVFDVGAHIGRISVLASGFVGDEGLVFAFEPIPETYRRLIETLALNRCINVKTFEMAIGSEVEPVTMNVFDSMFSSWNTMGTPEMKTGEGVITPKKAIKVECRTLDDFCEGYGIGRINFLKIDVEGFEKNVIVGAEKLLAEEKVDTICFEVSQDMLAGAGMEARDIFDCLSSLSYKSYGYDLEKDIFYGPLEDSDEHWANYYASTRDLSII